MKKLILSLLLSFNLYAVCKPTGAFTVDVIAKADYTAMFPLKVAGIPLAHGRIPDAFSSVVSPICACPAPPPVFIRYGFPVGFYEPNKLIEVVKDPFCFPLMGFGLGGSGGEIGGTAGEGVGNQSTFFQGHFYHFPLYAMLGMFVDWACFQNSDFDIAYITEIDPLWNNDTLSAIINPEALLFGNPIANLACMADSISSAVFFPLDILFWCKGSWGNAYPLTGQTGSDGYVEASASVAASLIYKLHRQLITWASWGYLCSKYPAPIWTKSAYRLQIVSPIHSIYATTIGTTGTMWTFAKNPPFIGDNFGYLVFKKRECCAF